VSLTIKRCTKCNEEKDISCFSKDKSVKSGFYSRCRTCCSLENQSKTKEQRDRVNQKSRERRREERLSDPAKVQAIRKYKQEYYLKHKQRLVQYSTEYNHTHRERHLEHIRAYGARNKHKRALYLSENADKIRETKRIRELERYNSDIDFKIRKSLRTRINKAISRGDKTLNLREYLGCSIEELKTYLESKFQPGMTWDNWGFAGWHIDHIRPLASFDLTNIEEFKVACHYTNLQPLWAKDNLSKANKLPDQHELTGHNHG
jgi:hypothetical protein